MIIVKIIGGLGNQLFQYAAAMALANKNRTGLKADVSGFENYDLRSFDLHKLNSNLSIASGEEVEALKAKSSFARVKQKLTFYTSKRFYKEPFFHYDADFFKLGKDVYMQGYFQSEKYFSPIENKIRDQFDLKNGLPDNIKEFATFLQSHQSIAIHIRKGDYKNAEALNVHGILPMSYYQNAVSFLQSELPDIKFYLFSDDMQTAQKEVAVDYVEPVSEIISRNHLEDLFLMSHCRHNIIANSSFSWWAAWLNNNPDKIVIAPKKWFNKGPKDTQDLIPERWIKL